MLWDFYSGFLVRTKYVLLCICIVVYILSRMVEVMTTDEFAAWYGELDEDDTKAVIRVVDLLAARGVSLPFPYSSDIKGSHYALRELRVQSGGKPLRILYAFDPQRQAVLLLGADKTGLSDKEFYATHVSRAETLWEKYLRETQDKS